MSCCNSPGKYHTHNEYITEGYLSNFYTKDQIDGILLNYYLKTETYSQAEIDALIPDITDFYTKAEIDSLLAIPNFLAIKTVTTPNGTGNGTPIGLIFNSEVFDYGSDYNNVTGLFIAPINGTYSFTFCSYLTPISSTHTFGYNHIFTTNRNYYANERNPYNVAGASTHNSVTMTIEADLDAGDFAGCSVLVDGGPLTVGIYGAATPYTYFSGHLVRRS